MRYVSTFAIAICIAASGFAADDKGGLVFKKGPSTAQLKAKNVDGENWEGPHVEEIKSFDDWDRVRKASADESILVFKHSTECPVNAKAAYRVNQWLEEQGDDAPRMVFVKVIETKPVSAKIAEDLSIEHQSPQVLLVEDGKGVWSTSHEEITAEAIEKALDEKGEKKDRSE